MRVDDGQRHHIVARRTGREGSLEIDGVVQESFRSPEGSHQMLNTKGNIYIGKRIPFVFFAGFYWVSLYSAFV